MTKRLHLIRDDPAHESPIKLLTFLLAVGAGVYLGWWIFLTPVESPVPGSSPPSAPSIPSPAVAGGLPVQPTGSPATSLGGIAGAGSPAPDFTLSDLEGQAHSLGQHLGQVVLINFWTTWCPPCRVEMPALQRAYEKYQDQGFIVLGINLTQMDDPEKVEPFVEELGLAFPILLDAESDVSRDLYHIIALPTSVFVGRDAVIEEIFAGALRLEDLEIKIESMLKDTP